jgi:hypothetical protein
MKTRCFDHINLRVKGMEVARKFYGQFLPALGFVHESPGDDFHTFYAGGADRPMEFQSPTPFTLQEQRSKQRTEISLRVRAWRFASQFEIAVIFYSSWSTFRRRCLRWLVIFRLASPRILTLSIRRRVRTVWSEGIFRRG